MWKVIGEIEDKRPLLIHLQEADGVFRGGVPRILPRLEFSKCPVLVRIRVGPAVFGGVVKALLSGSMGAPIAEVAIILLGQVPLSNAARRQTGGLQGLGEGNGGQGQILNMGGRDELLARRRRSTLRLGDVFEVKPGG